MIPTAIRNPKRRAENPRVGGSIPPLVTIQLFLLDSCFRASRGPNSCVPGFSLVDVHIDRLALPPHFWPGSGRFESWLWEWILD